MIKQKRQYEIVEDAGNRVDAPWPGDEDREPAELLWQDDPDFDQFFTDTAPDLESLYLAHEAFKSGDERETGIAHLLAFFVALESKGIELLEDSGE
tara:strand:- start:4698 stop:4985 length:288 start_codon:yes stop_codon:yes gene_type:complete